MLQLFFNAWGLFIPIAFWMIAALAVFAHKEFPSRRIAIIVIWALFLVILIPTACYMFLFIGSVKGWGPPL